MDDALGSGGGGVSRTVAIGLAIALAVVGAGIGYGLGIGAGGGDSDGGAATSDNVLKRIYQRGYMIVGTDAAFPPFEEVDQDTGEIVGFDIDIINAIADRLGVDVEMRNIGWDPLFTAVPDKTLDLAISAMTITEEREDTFLFSEPYFRSNLTIVIKAGGPMEGEITNASDLEDRSIALQEFTTSDGWVEDTLKGEMDIQPSEVRKTGLFTDAIQLLSAEEVDAVIIDEPVARSYESAGQVTVVQKIVTNEKFGIPMPPGEVALKGAIDGALADVRASGEYDQAFDEWFGA